MGKSVCAKRVKNNQQYQVWRNKKETKEIVTVIGWFTGIKHNRNLTDAPKNMRDDMIRDQELELDVYDCDRNIWTLTKEPGVDKNSDGGSIWDGKNRITFHEVI
jgi:hypothetical protein